MKDQIFNKLHLIEDEQTRVSGYDIEEIKKVMNQSLFDAFQKWFAGQTMAIIRNKYCVYHHDLDRYLSQKDEALKRIGVAKITR